jgi:uncharacterized protein
VKVVVLGATSTLGTRISDELLRRGHDVLPVIRRPGADASPAVADGHVLADVKDPESVASAVKGADAVVSTVGPARGEDASLFVTTARALLAGLRVAHVRRLVVVDGWEVLELPPRAPRSGPTDVPGGRDALWDAHQAALDIYRAERDLEWTVIASAARVTPGARSGHYRGGGDRLLVDARGESRITAEDYAVAVADEVESPRHLRRRFCVAAG